MSNAWLDHASPDGSPVPVYLALPAGETPSVIDRVVPSESDVLELGAATGRITRVLAALGHRMTAVDNDPVMLAHVTTAEVVCADLFELNLGRRFDVVIAGSHLVNSPDPARRRRLLAMCAQHLREGGLALVERYDQAWARSPNDVGAALGPVDVSVTIESVGSDSFKAVAEYRLGTRTWRQPFSAAAVDRRELEDLAEQTGFELCDWANERKTWAVLRRVG